ncbi:MAG: tetratricopeptide repeat protein [Anaerolineae bacterium]|nr:tetratricopeptide repeat protein [Anaerolineae bacterium]
METVATYIPIDRRLALAEGRNLPERAQGGALFADISGFTPLTEMLSRQLGPRRGAEELTRQLNRVYDGLIGVLHRYGGSVIGFSGDAITCWLDGDDGQRGTAAAFAMQAVMSQFANIQFGTERVTLALKVAVVVGPVRRFIVGDPNYLLMDVLAGQTLSRLAAAEHVADKGEVIIDAQAAAALAEGVQIKEWRVDHETQERYAAAAALTLAIPEKPWPYLPPDRLTDEQTKAWILPDVYRRLQAAQGAFLAELRPSSALFLRFGGIDYDNDENAPQKLNQFIQAVEKILARYEGSLLQLTIGDKGSYLYASMGAPIAHEDNVDRNLRVAWELQALNQQLDFLEPLQIGVTYGRMYAGAYGGQARRTYGVLGDAVNLAARLMQAAQPGQILVNEAAYSKASDVFSWETLPAIQVKGKSEPVVLNRLAGIKAHRTLRYLDTVYPHPPLGREEIFALLDERLRWLRQGKGQVIRLVGEAGMGKTHVAAEFSRRARAQQVRLAVGPSHSLTRNSLYQPWRAVFYTLLDLDDTNESLAIAQLTSYLQETQPDWLLRLPLLGDLLGLPIPDNPTTAALDSALRQKALFSLLVEMLQTSASRQPLILILDNAHWMDEASESLTEVLAHQAVGTAPLMLLLLYRPELIGGTVPLPDLVRLPYFTALVLDEMRDAQIQALLTTQLGQPVSPLLLAVIQTLAQGNPFFAAELVNAMRQGGKVIQEEGAWTISADLVQLLQKSDLLNQQQGTWQLKPNVDLSSVKLGLPDSIHGLVLAQLDRLPESHKLTLKVSSVLGHYIDLLLVKEVHPEEKDVTQIEAEAAYMEAEEVVHQEEVPDRKIYAFRQQTTQEVAYQTLLHAQRQQLHQAVAEVLATTQPEAMIAIAHHAFLGELWPLALSYNLLAGEWAKKLYANQQALDFLRKALHSAHALPDMETQDPLKQIHLAMGELLVATGQYDAAGQHLAEALRLAQAQQDWLAEATCYRWYGRAYEVQGEYAAALSWLDKGFAVLRGRVSSQEAEISLIAGLINYRQGHFSDALQLCQRGLTVGQTLADAAIQARAYNLMGIVTLRQDSQAAIQRFQQSLSQYEQLQNVYGQAASHNLMANGFFALGQWRTADTHYRRSLDLFVQIGDLYNQVLVNNNLGGIALKQGRLDEALGYYQRAVRLLQQTGGSVWVLGALHLNVGHTYIRLHHLDQAAAELKTAQAYFNQAQLRDLLPELYGLFAEGAWLQGDLVGAEQHGHRSLDLARELSMPREEGYTLRILGEIARARGEITKAEQLFQQSFQTLAEAGDEYEAACTQLSLAQLYAAQQQKEPAEAALASCEPLFVRLEAQLDLTTVQLVRQGLGLL